MEGVRAGSGRQVAIVMAGFAISGAVAALASSRSFTPSASQGSPRDITGPALGLTALPAAFRSIRSAAPPSRTARTTHWAPVVRPADARSSPRFNSPPIAWVGTRTPEGTTNIVVATKEVERRGVLWERVMLSVLPNGREGWVPRTSLGGWSFVDTRLVIDRTRLTATLLRAQRVVFRASVGVGAAGTPTPAGQFYIRDRLSDYTSPMYGPLAFGTNARSPTLTDWPAGGFVGIHGTNRPDLIPGRVSHGCIRLTNRAIVRLGKLMPVGTLVTVR